MDNANFLSFEEWKLQNLAKIGQSPENLGREQQFATERQRPGINNALDTLGEESEIAINPPPGGHKPEFDGWAWQDMRTLPDLIVPFKRAVYEEVVAEFAPLLRAAAR